MPNDQDTDVVATRPEALRKEELSGQVGMATYVAAKIFGSAPLPPGMPDWLQGSIESQANFAQRLPGTAELTLGPAGGGPLNAKTKAERQREAGERSAEYVAVMSEEAERRQQREMWAQQTHSVAGVEMTGAEWSRLAERLRNDEDLKRRITEAFRGRGMSEDEAETRYERVADVAEIAAIPPSQRTEQQAATISKAEADPSFKRDMQDTKRAADIHAGQAGPLLSDNNPIQAASPPVTIVTGPAF